MNQQDLWARTRLCGLLGQLLLDGSGGVARSVARLGWTIPDDPDEAHTAWMLEIYPRASVFLGDVDPQVRGLLAAARYAPRRNDVEPDHVGVLLLALSWVYGGEADGIPGAHEVRVALERFLSRWLPALAVASRRHSLYFAALSLAAELTAQDVAEDVVVSDVLGEQRAGLKQIALHLLDPAQAGWFLSRSDIQRIARRSGLACGFGPRWKMLESLWFSAVDHGRVGELVGVLEDERIAWEQGYAELAAPTEAWRERLEATTELLGRLEAAA